MATGRLGLEETLGALNAALGPGGPVWFKETRARHLRVRDFLAPRRALQARFGDGQGPCAPRARRAGPALGRLPAAAAGGMARCPGASRSLSRGPEEARAGGGHPGGRPGSSARRRPGQLTEDLLSVLAELQAAAQLGPEDGSPGLAPAPGAGADSCVVVHVVSPEEESQQQKLDLLWWKLDEQAPLAQKHLVCGPVRAAGAPSTLTAPEYYELRLAQVHTASALKHSRDLAQDPAWTETFRVLSAATIKFEMLSKAPQSQLLLDLADSISTKGTKSGTFVMYNCARLATLFEGYQRGVQQGLYPTFPPVSSLDFSLLREEGEWLLLFNSVLPFRDLLSQSTALDGAHHAPGLRVTARTEMVCKFLVQLSMDFSAYYNRVHILGVSTQQGGVGGAGEGAKDETSRPSLFPGASATPVWSDVCPAAAPAGCAGSAPHGPGHAGSPATELHLRPQRASVWECSQGRYLKKTPLLRRGD
ncbi:DALR anticodon-binding domain-containing protein 3 isoform X4 [Myotis daubentonii]|uniref:DALR anticodon-binding domain-containing protein 3 isoform X4 n=1 Tax=Myotis daubentonii TaxID=98922 RepID=UPI00287352C5|nr:DALR anticodon-binding domain-containing protein 3 isoform X4 [Myotis daubentonii]